MHCLSGLLKTCDKRRTEHPWGYWEPRRDQTPSEQRLNIACGLA